MGDLTEQLEQRAIFSLLGEPGGLKVLDVGCGDGTNAMEVSRRGGNAFGLDRSLPMLTAAKTRADLSDATTQFCQGTGDSLPFRDSSFDLVLAVTVLCWLPEPIAALKEMNRVLRPGGTLVVGELGRWSLWALVRRLRGLMGSRSWRGCHFWTVKELARVLARAGLRAREIRCAVYYPPSDLLARLMAPFEGARTCRKEFGAAFIAVRSIKDLPEARF